MFASAGAELGCAHSKGVNSAVTIFVVLVLPKTQRKGLRLHGIARRRAAALGSLWLECATTLVVSLHRTMPRLFDCAALQAAHGHIGAQYETDKFDSCVRVCTRAQSIEHNTQFQISHRSRIVFRTHSLI